MTQSIGNGYSEPHGRIMAHEGATPTGYAFHGVPDSMAERTCSASETSSVLYPYGTPECSKWDPSAETGPLQHRDALTSRWVGRAF